MTFMVPPFAYLPHRAILSLTGPDTITLLERLVTHATNDWAPDETRYGALLTPQGKVLADYLAIRTRDGVLLDVSDTQIDDLAKRLKMFRLRSQVEIERLDDVSVIAGLDAAPERRRPISGAQRVYLDPRMPGGRLRGLIAKERWAPEHGNLPAEWSQPIAAYHADRIAHCIPEQGFDFGQADAFPADINMDILGGVALNKGCFVGQEVVSRMHRRGQIRKRTLTVRLAAGLAAQPGMDLHAPAPIGSVTSAQKDQALARLRIDRWLKAEADGMPVLLDETPVTIEKPDWLIAEQRSKEES